MTAGSQSNGELGQSALDEYLGRCVMACLRASPCPTWPDGLTGPEKAAADRIAYHGIALLLVEQSDATSTWPAAIKQEVHEEARRQSFWETSHHRHITGLLDAFHAAGIDAIVTKGTALAYSVYPNPAMRRRGDSDIVVPDGNRGLARAVIRDCGFQPCHDARALQETWQAHAPPNFTHQIDLHWRINASAAIAERLEASDPFERAIHLPDLSSHARGLTPADNLILTCINRTSHNLLGYAFGADTVFDGDRLIWAVDIDLITRSFGESTWGEMINRAKACDAASTLASGLTFAQSTCGTKVPDGVIEQLSIASKVDDLSAILSPSASGRRLQLDLAASPTLRDKARLLRYAASPSRAFLRARYPDAKGWPVAALGMRRAVAGVGKWLRKRL